MHKEPVRANISILFLPFTEIVAKIIIFFCLVFKKWKSMMGNNHQVIRFKNYKRGESFLSI